MFLFLPPARIHLIPFVQVELAFLPPVRATVITTTLVREFDRPGAKFQACASRIATTVLTQLDFDTTKIAKAME
jgi:hypothetical protein